MAEELRAQATARPDDLHAVIRTDNRIEDFTSADLARWAPLVPISEARGLEFDAIIVVTPDAAARPGGERDLYVALTRATKRLCTIALSQHHKSPQETDAS